MTVRLGYCFLVPWALTTCGIVLFVREVASVRITRLSVPKWVENGTMDSVLLDCNYEVTSLDYQLVLKWFLNRDPNPIYQWIPELGQRVFSPDIVGHINQNFSIMNGNSKTKYRALNLLRPTTEFSGTYSCHVTSMDGQDVRAEQMTVYARPKHFHFTFTKVNTRMAVFTCRAEGVFPRPKVFLFHSTKNDLEAKPMGGRETLRLADGSYIIEVSKEINDTELSKDETHVFQCVLSIPGTDYRHQQQLEYDWNALTSRCTSVVISWFGIVSMIIYCVSHWVLWL